MQPVLCYPCQFYQLHTSIIRLDGTDNKNKKNVLREQTEAVRIATDIGDIQLLAATYFRQSQIHMEHDNYGLAKEVIQGALDRIRDLIADLLG